MKVAVVGTGYVGLVTGACLAESGNHVTCVDIDHQKIEKLKQGIMPIYERGLAEIVHHNAEQGRLHFTTSLQEGVHDALVIMLALPTPPGEDGSADLQYVLKVADDLAPLLRQYTVVVNKSTVPVGTAELVQQRIAAKTQVEFDVVSNPEFLREGLAVEDFLKPERVVVGTRSERARKIMAQLYAPFTRQGNPILFMDERSSELTKYAANAFLATKITFMNEVASLCERLGADVDKVRIGMGTDSRIGKRFLFAGIGYGGSCFPKDVQALAHTARKTGYEFKILDAVETVNQRQRQELARRVIDFFGGNVKQRKLALWGLAFKPHTDDIREAPALYNIDILLEQGAQLTVHDPEAMENVKRKYSNRLNYANNPYDALDNAEALLIATEWPEYRNPDFSLMAEKLKNPLIFDGRNLYEPDQIRELGFIYFSIGRQTVKPA
jgi:UDPglucose 6-dehydrogenase